MSRYRVARAMALVAVVAVGLLHAQSPQWQNLFPSYNGLAFGNGKFVTVSGDGVIKTTEDGRVWTQAYGLTGDMRSFLSVGYGEDAGFLVTQLGTGLMFSGDGLNWRIEATNIPYSCRHVAYGAGVFVGVGDDGAEPMTFRFDTRDEDRDWESGYAPPATMSLARAAFGADRYVAAGSNIISSTALNGGRSWTPAAISTPGGVGAVAFGGDRFAALGVNGTSAYTSEDGASWQSHTVSAPQGMADMAYGAGKFVAVGANGRAASSADGTSWTASTLNEGENFVGVKFGNGMFMAVGARGAVYTSADGSGWTRQAGGRYMTYRQIIQGGSKLVAVGDSGVAVSSDGLDWSARTAGKRLRAVTYGAGRFVAVGDSGAIFSSADGDTWTDHSLPQDSRDIMLKSAAFGEGAFIIGGKTPVGGALGGPSIYSSTDGQNWTEQISLSNWLPPEFPVSMAFGAGKFVAADSSTNGSLKYANVNATSPGRYWSNVTLPGTVSHRIVQVTYTGDRFVALGVTGGGAAAIMLSSTDGTVWTITQGVPATARSITYAKNHYIVAADSGRIYASATGGQWHVLSKATNRNLTAIYFDGTNTMYAAGVAGTMLVSTEQPVSVRHTTAPRKASGKWGMTLDNTRRPPTVTLSFTPEKPGTISLYTLTGKQIFKKTVGAGERSVRLPSKMINGTVIVKYSGGDGRTAVQRFRIVR
ncbi:MAG: hypothetical protein FWB85_08320 [Chitinispirillia bacterium]|nr:hypothetical protein [Chitinispirillia bacterium]MCL2242263.1 hypothetical protein [Chitinispirillia bacterium]